MTEARYALTILTRLARRRPEEEAKLRQALAGRVETLWQLAFDVAAEVGDPIGRILADVLESEHYRGSLEPLVRALPAQTVALGEVAVVLLLRRAAEAADRAPLSEAALRSDLAARLGAVGRREEALAESERALALTHAMPAKRQRHALEARVLAGMSTNLAELGRNQEALAAMERAVAFRRSLAAGADEFEAHRELAAGLGLLASCLSALGRRLEARRAVEEAIIILENCFEHDEAVVRPLLSDQLSKLGVLHIDLGETEQGIAATGKALQLSRDLAARRPDEFGFVAAVNANNLANNLSLRGSFAEALPLAREAVETMAELARGRPQAYGEHHATALNTLSNRLNDLGESAEARAMSEQSVAIMRDLAGRWPATFEGKLARSLHSLAYRLCELGETDRAISHADEALALRRRLEVREPRVYGVAVAMTLAVRATALRRAGNLPQACLDIAAALDQLLLQARIFGTALAREAQEIGGRAVLWHKEADLAPNQDVLDELQRLTEISGYVTIS